MNANEFTLDIKLNAPLEKVWQAITEPQYIEKWYAFGGATVDLKPGGSITFSWDEHGTYRGIIEEVRDRALLSFRYNAFNADTDPADDNALIVVIELTNDNDITTLRLTERGYDSLAQSAEEKAENFEMNKNAWSNSLSSLKELVEA